MSSSQEELDELADACVAAGRLVRAHGSPELQRVMRIALYVLGRDLSDRMAERDGRDGQADGAAGTRQGDGEESR